MEEVEQLSPDGGLVEITGGEPMLQEREVVPFMQRLLDAGYTVLLETSGERPLQRVPRRVVKIVDVKCPNSGEPDTFHMENLDCLNPEDEVKFVLSDRSDYEFARDFVTRHGLDRQVNAVLFSPAFSKQASGARDASCCLLDPRELAEWMLADGVLRATRAATAQVHLGSGDERGLSSAGVPPARWGGQGRPPDSRRDAGATQASNSW